MYQFVFLAGLVVLNLVLAFINFSRKSTGAQFAGGFNAVVAVIIALITAYNFINRPTEADFKNEIARYNCIKNEIEVAEKIEDPDIRAIIIPRLVAEINSMNNTISKNKDKYKSKWDGCYYSEEIANLEPLTIHIYW